MQRLLSTFSLILGLSAAAFGDTAMTCVNFVDPTTSATSGGCDPGPTFALSSGFTWTDHSFTASLYNWVEFEGHSEDQFVDIHGYQQAGASGWFVVKGGSGQGKMAGWAIGEGSYDATNAWAQETFDSNFSPFYPTYDWGPVTFNFTYNVPFELHLYDRIDYSSAPNSNNVWMNDLTAVYDLTFDTFLDSNGQVVPDAVFSSAPEPSTWMLLGLGLAACAWRKLSLRARVCRLLVR